MAISPKGPADETRKEYTTAFLRLFKPVESPRHLRADLAVGDVGGDQGAVALVRRPVTASARGTDPQPGVQFRKTDPFGCIPPPVDHTGRGG